MAQLEIVVIPVSDVGPREGVLARLGWSLDADYDPWLIAENEGAR